MTICKQLRMMWVLFQKQRLLIVNVRDINVLAIVTKVSADFNVVDKSFFSVLIFVSKKTFFNLEK